MSGVEVELGDVVLNVEQEDRAVALAVARDILLVKAGKFAERPLDAFDLIRIAEWILDGDDEDHAPMEVITVDAKVGSGFMDDIRRAVQRREGAVTS